MSNNPPSRARLLTVLTLATAFNIGIMSKFIYELIHNLAAGDNFRVAVNVIGILIVAWALKFLAGMWKGRLKPSPSNSLKADN